MNHYISLNRFGLLMVVAGMMIPASKAMASPRAYSAHGTANFTGPTTFVGRGNATHLGRYTEAGSVTFTPTGNPAVSQIAGSIVYTAANGAQLFASFTGTLNGATGTISATLTYTGGTARFASATGSSLLSGQIAPDGIISVDVNGTIDY